MKLPDAQRPKTFGYLHVLHDDASGYTGGLLVLCDRGRPLEFHCTETVRPTRAQEILFGPTLEDYLCGELIGSSLLAKAKVAIGVLLTADQASSTAGAQSGLPTIVLEPSSAASHLALEHLASVIDPMEPFERVRDAILEAQRLVSGGDDRAAA